MKKVNLKKSVLALVMMVATVSFAKANDRTASVQSMDASVNSYVSLLKYGELKNFDKLFTDDAKFSVSSNGKVISHSKNEEFNFLSKNKGVTQQCEILSSVIVNTVAYSIVKVSMIYDTFTRENYITLVKAGENWKINAVSSEFK